MVPSIAAGVKNSGYSEGRSPSSGFLAASNALDGGQKEFGNMAVGSIHPSVDSIGANIAALIERHMDRTFRRLRSERAEIDPRFVRIITGAPHPFGNFVLCSDSGDADAAQAAIAPRCTSGAPAAALLIGAASSDVDALLRSAGFQPLGVMPGMAVDIERLAPAPSPEGCTLERFTAGEREDAWIDAFAEGYEIPRVAAAEVAPGTMGAGDAQAPVQFFGLIEAGRIVATSAMVLDDGVAGIYCVSTIPEARGRGLGAFVTAAPLRAAREMGYGVGVLQSSEAGHSVYRRLGFADHGGVPLYVRIPASE